MENLLIENFGGIKKLDFDFKSINILIGPQGAGKSITVKLLYFFKSFTSEMVKSIENSESKRELDRKQIETFLTFFPRETWSKDDFRVIYKFDNSEISISKIANKLTFDYSENLKKLLNKAKKIYSDEKIKLSESRKVPSFRIRRELRQKIQHCVKNELGETSISEQYFIPAGRSFFANIQSSIFSFLSDNRSLDPFLIEFGSFYENFKVYGDDFVLNERLDKEFDDLISEILGSKYIREKDKDFLLHNDNRKVNLTNASSGQQETLPLVIILKALHQRSMANNGFTLYIEEPEAHLFPTAQKRIVQLLARTFNGGGEEKKFQLFVTTHSPYIISSFNNLMFAGDISTQNIDKKGTISKIVTEKEQLESELFKVYSLKNSQKKDLMNNENRIISQSILDSVSDEIALEFDKLLDIEF